MAVAPDGALQPAHLLQRIVHRMVACVVDGLLGAPDGDRRFGYDLGRTLQRSGQHGFLRIKDGIDQAVLQRALSVEAPTCVGHFLDHGQRDQLGQAL